mmetsp:Transcript_1351/g.2740  ORF Transcript_1351/g.2740 Transcript_1351/m.2740 type:complete len:398 (-) Transcript_1351:69-1262(-)|eukprot:CAMPEP_0113302334 /NCGR_PEP_ID=MMETSP0010_2-20120614/3185_1 /TAXON_ID=216773 ORGANISM="Corethron hystrix, Strain 308" /NCGR_SAMPLE_ID=MMETSP0010_2 /ASSEMBLY_ACC=CAM_ASM_000155 /LENGTH=397 /DNA_ID=CAMNT_0000156097 /DNA_START=80 /DNA_END=1273 /DNA_ORIENTATION=- /assembly_acc=CAM_ASM_000155
MSLGGNSRFSGPPRRRPAPAVSNSISPAPSAAIPSVAPYGDVAIVVKDMSFSYYTTAGGTANAVSSTRMRKARKTGNMNVLSNVDVKLATGSRCLLIGANGSGKSTLLRILAGRHLVHESSENPVPVSILGMNAFRATELNYLRTYLDVDWGLRNVSFVGGAVPFMADVPVRGMMAELQNAHPERRDELMDMLMIDPEWRMHELSDGQRRRVQILIALVRPFKVLLLDEVTTSLDVCVRRDLLMWLEKESKTRGATIIYATHIFDGLDGWATHMHHITDDGTTGWYGEVNDHPVYQELVAAKHPAVMLALAERILRPEMERAKEERRFGTAAGATAFAADPTDRNGGYGSGRNFDGQMRKEERLASQEEKKNDEGKSRRQGRLSDIMGNAGVLSKHT